MKKLILNLFVLSALILSTSCSKDDDGGNTPAANQLTASFDGTALTFNAIVVDDNSEADGSGYYDVAATINGDTTKIISFFIDQNDSGANAIQFFTYVTNGRAYSNFSINSQFNSVVSVNDGSRITATFSGQLSGYNPETDMDETITVTNGSINVGF